MDIVYLIKVDPENDSEELRYSLRSLKNIPHQKVVIVGEKPEWATNVEFIPVAQTKTKHQNWSMSLSAAVRSDRISDDFIMMNDDFFFMKKIHAMPHLNMGDMKQVIDSYNARYPAGSEYIDKMTKLYAMLVENGRESPVSYELHVPVILNKQNVLDMYRDAGDRPLYQFRSYYGNYFNVESTLMRDVKVFMDPLHNDPLYNENPEKYLASQTFLSTTGGSFKRGKPGDYIRKMFPEKSPYER